MSLTNPIYEAQAQTAFDEFVSRYPNYEHVYIRWARALSGMNKPREALAALDVASQISPPPVSIEFWRAVILLSMDGQAYRDTIVAGFQSEVDIGTVGLLGGDVSPDTLREAVAYLVKVEEWDLAEHYQAAVVQLLPSSIDDRINLAVIYRQIGEFDEAAKQARWVVKIDPSKLEATQVFLESIGQSL